MGGRYECLALWIVVSRARANFDKIRPMPNANYGSDYVRCRARRIFDGKPRSVPTSRTLPVTPIDS